MTPTNGDMRRALMLILNQLDRPEWSIETLCKVSEIMAHFGYHHNDDIDWDTWEEQNAAINDTEENWKRGEIE